MRTVFCAVLIGLAGLWTVADQSDAAIPGQAAAVVPWGKPLQGGPIKALFVVPQAGLHDVAELAQRLDLDYSVAPVGDAAPGAAAGTPAEETAALLRGFLERRPDLIVIGNADLSMLPEDTLTTVQQCVAEGAGLLLAYQAGASRRAQVGARKASAPLFRAALPRSNRAGLPEPFQEFLDGLVAVEDLTPITAGVGEGLTPEWSGGLDFVRASTCGRGRVVELDYLGAPPRTHCLLPSLTQPLHARPEFLDVYFSLVAKAARWAAGKDASVRIAKVEYAGPSGPDEAEIPPDLPKEFVQAMRDAAPRLPYRAYRVTLSASAERALRVSAQVREPERPLRTLYDYEELLAKGRDSYLIPLPVGPGRYFLDVWLRDRGKVVDWYTEVITVEGWPEFSDVTFSKSELLPNDTLDISLNIRPLFHNPRACLAYARATDSLGRRVAEQYQAVPAAGGPVRISLGFSDLIAGMLKVGVFVADVTEPPLGHLDLQYAAHYATCLPVRRVALPDTFRLIAGGGASPEYNELAGLRTLAVFGVDMVHVPATPAWRQALCELSLLPLPELARYDCGARSDGAAQAPCFSDPAFRAAEAARIEEGAALFWAGGSAMYSLGGGNSLAETEENGCPSPSCLQGFRESLRDCCGTLEALNAAWGTDFDEWDAARPCSQEEARTSGRFGGWVTFRCYMDDVFCGIHAYARDVVYGVDRSGRVGCRISPASPAYQGYDWYRLASELDVLAAAPDYLTIEKLRSYRRPRTSTGVSVGTSGVPQTAEQARWLPWYLVLHQMSLLWWGGAPADSASGTPCAALMPDGRPSVVFAAAAESVSALREAGYDALLSRAVPVPARIAVYAGRPSELVSLVEPSFGADGLLAEVAFARMLERLGYSYDFIAPEMVVRGQLQDYEMLILPMARALSDAELAAIRAFHAGGGRLMADIAPGQFDERGASRPQLPLDEVFGVSRDGPPQAGAAVDGRIAWPSEDIAPPFAASLSTVVADTSLRAASARACGAAGETPIWLVTGDEPWSTLLLNHVLASRTASPGGLFRLHENPASDEEVVQGLLDAALGRMGVSPVVPLSRAEGAAGGIECFAFRYDKAEVAVLLRDPGEGGKKRSVSLHFSGDRCVYDSAAAARIRGSQKVRASLKPGEARLFSILPYEVTEVGLTTPASTCAGDRLPVRVLVKTQKALPGEHLVRIEISPGTGVSLAHYSQHLVCRAGEGETFVPLALDETPGLYTVTARDVLTGLTSEVTVKVLPRTGSLLPQMPHERSKSFTQSHL